MAYTNVFQLATVGLMALIENPQVCSASVGNFSERDQVSGGELDGPEHLVWAFGPILAPWVNGRAGDGQARRSNVRTGIASPRSG